jgi:hypothetical protein
LEADGGHDGSSREMVSVAQSSRSRMREHSPGSAAAARSVAGRQDRARPRLRLQLCKIIHHIGAWKCNNLNQHFMSYICNEINLFEKHMKDQLLKSALYLGSYELFTEILRIP